MNNLNYTPEQLAAIEDRGGSLLTAAAAGSGKTKVLVERLMRRVAEEGASITDFLIITYTRAAAAELRGRILDDLMERSAADPENRHLRRQSALVYQADIGTIHALCGKLIRENAHLLDLNPDFRMADEQESELLRRQVLEEVLNDRYDHLDDFTGFGELADTVSTGRDDTRLLETALDTYASLQSHPYPEQWAEKQMEAQAFTALPDASETHWGRYLMERAKIACDYWIRTLEASLPEVQAERSLMKAYGPCWDGMLDWLRGFQTALTAGWDEAHSCGTLFWPKAAGRASGYEALKDQRRRCKAELDKITDLFALTSAQVLADLEAVRPAANALMALTMDFDAAYAREKRRRGLLDFSDLEHCAVRLLYDRETGDLSETARALNGRWTEVMVDEFQDVNRTQDMIFRAVSGGRLFLVGDVKQSIYRFRLADPGIFLAYYKRFPDAAEALDGEPRKVTLSRNFRSAAGILEAVNFVFSRIMSEEFGEMDYTRREYLNPGGNVKETGAPPVELDIIDLFQLPKDGDGTPGETEARFVASRIRALADKEGYAFGDIVILLRSVTGKAALYEKALASAGIPAISDKGEDFFAQTEVSVLLSLLNVVDNPVQDVPLIAVLHSPLYGFTADDLAKIRQADPSGSFYDALQKTAETEEACRRFLNELEIFRLAAPDYTADAFLWHVYSRTDALQIFGAMENGKARRENLMELFSKARRFESGGYRGPSGFIRHMLRLAERGETAASGRMPDANAVRIMSVHKSKGLEFPVVFLSDLAKGFNFQDARKQVLAHPELGLGVQRRDWDRRIHYPTIAKAAIAEKLKAETLAEELRVLYVGMTRPKERLILTCAYGNAGKKLLSLSYAAKDKPEPYVLESAASMADWLILTALTRPECGHLHPNGAQAPLEELGAPWLARRISWQEIPEAPPPRPATEPGKAEEGPARAAADPETVALLENRLAFRYPYPGAGLPSKLTATELKGRSADQEVREDAAVAEGPERAFLFERPAFVKAKRPLTGAERGAALHLAMQYIDFHKCRDRAGIAGELVRLTAESRITSQQAEAVNPERIARFFRSELGRTLLASPAPIREFKFSLLAPAALYHPDAGQEQILLQGVVDCCFEEGNTLTVLDFKTDAVTERTVQERARQYRGQLDAYAYALERILEKPVGRKLLYFFSLDRVIAL